MATATNTFSHYDRRESSESDNPTLSTQTRRFVTVNPNSTPPRPGQHLDDADLLAWRRQFANIGLREQNVMSNSADDLSQLDDRLPYQFEGFGQDYNDIEDDELHFDNGNSFDYDTAIQERLKRANEEFKHDETPVELKHPQRVSFDAVVKAVDIDQELDNTDPLARPPVSPVAEESSISATSPQDENNPHEYTVPLNDTQPKEGPTLLQQLKAMQFHGVLPIGERWSSTNPNTTNGSSIREEDLSLTKSNSNNNSDLNEPSDMTTKSSSSSQKSMVVSINGEFELQNEDDYIAKNQTKFDNDDNNDRKSSTRNMKTTFLPTPPTETKQQQDSLKPQAPQRPYSSTTRPKSSDSGKRTKNFDNVTSRSWSDNKNNSTRNNQQRPKSAGVSKSLEPFIMRPSSGVDFEALNRKAAAEKREQEQEKRRKEKEAAKEREIQLAKAKESFEKWVHDKDVERKRLNEEKRLEKEEHEAREAQYEKELAELREKKYQEWVARKNRDVMIVNEFKKLQADEEMASGGSSSSVHSANRRENHRAFNRWLRRKYEQSKEEQRQLRLEARRLRRRQRRSIKRFQLQQDLQLAKSFGYS